MTDQTAAHIAAAIAHDIAAVAYRAGSLDAPDLGRVADEASARANGTDQPPTADRAASADWMAAAHEDEAASHREAAEEEDGAYPGNEYGYDDGDAESGPCWHAYE